MLRSENIHTTPLLGGHSTWITAPVDDFPDLYPIYLAHLERLSGEETKGETQYTQLSPGDFRRLSPTKQIEEFRTLGVDAYTDQEVLRILLGPGPDSSENTYSLPVESVIGLPLLDILHHERYLGKHIRHVVKIRGDAIRLASSYTRTKGQHYNRASTFKSTIASIQKLTKDLEADRRLLLLLANRRKAILKQLRHQPRMTIFVMPSTLTALPQSNYYAPLQDDIGHTHPAGGESTVREDAPQLTPSAISDPTHDWSPRRTRHQRHTPPMSNPAPCPKKKDSTMDITLEHAAELARRVNIPSRLPDPGPFSHTGGFKILQAATISQQLVVTYLNVGGLTSTKLHFILPT